MKRALSIAGSDSGGGAGIQADLKTFAAHGVYGASAITAVTAQNTLGVTGVEVVSPSLVRAQIDAVLEDIGADAAKTGMLATAGIVETVADAIAAHRIPFVVVDPVMIAKSGDRLLDDAALEALRTQLLPLAYVVTPNIPEAEALSGLSITTDDDRLEAARCIADLGPRAVILKGGHFGQGDIVDLLFDRGETVEFRHARVASSHAHGTGCTFAAALAAHLALGRTLREAVPLVQEYIAGAIAHAPDIGGGHGPMNHFWKG